MNSTANLIKPPSERDYDEDVLYGHRMLAKQADALIKDSTQTECVTYTIGTAYAHPGEWWKVENLTGKDKRLKTMFEKLNINCTLPIQRYTWPKIEAAKFPILSVSPEFTGKTMTHLLYSVTRCITSVPIARTNAMLSTNETLGTFKTNNSNTHCNLPANLSNIDQENFDFDSLGAIPESLQHETNSANEPGSGRTNGRDQSVEDTEDPWGLKTEDHFEVDVDEFIFHPKYIIVSSNQHQVELMDRQISGMKLAAFGDDRMTNLRLKDLPPKVKTLNIHQDDDKLALKCNEAEILIATPGPLIKCFELGYLNFKKCKKLFFDDLDLTLQLHNFNVKELIKRYMVEIELEHVDDVDDSSDQKPSKDCQICFFSRKWTDLVKQFLQAVFPQIIIMFGSIAEAALYANMRYDLEICTGNPNSKLAKLLNLIKLSVADTAKNETLAVVCQSDQEAERVSQAIIKQGSVVKFLPEETAILAYKSRTTINGSRNPIKPIYVMGDKALDLVSQDLTDVNCIIHYSMPQSMLTFDGRFRIMHANIREAGKKIVTTIFLNSGSNAKHVKEIYDMVSRSSTTLKSTKLELRDLISDTSNKICWRWASSGLCRLEKLSRDDRFGTYCPDKHSVTQGRLRQTSKWPTGGQFKITITHLVSPNEFYFWFEAHRDKDSVRRKWTKLDSTGSEFMRGLQNKLNKFKETSSYSISVDELKRGRIYGVYLQQEARVDRVRLMEEPEIDTTLSKLTQFGYKFSKQCEVLKIDYGVRIAVYLKNLFLLPDPLANIEPQCHRGFHLGVKPCDNEPDWLFKANRRFYELVCVSNLHEITVWHRLESNNCFWFEKMMIVQKLGNIDDKQLCTSEPHSELIQARLAARSTTEPSCLNPSERSLTLSKWHVEQSNDFVQYAFLRRDKPILDIYVLHILSNLDLTVRLFDYNKQLIELERTMLEDFNEGKLRALNYFKVGVYCLAKIQEGIDHETKQPIYTINRARIWNLISISGDHDEPKELGESKFEVECLDHGDLFNIGKSDLYQAAPEYLSLLPFQAIKGQRLANLNQEILDDADTAKKVIFNMYNYTRDDTDQLVKLACRFKDDGKLQIYVPTKESMNLKNPNLESIESLFKRIHDIDLIK